MNPKALHSRGPRRHTQRFATLFLIFCACLPAAHAKDRKAHTSAAIKVIANMTFDNKPVADMLIHEVNGKPYLYVQLANAQGTVVVDISKPNKLKVVSSMSGPESAEASGLSINGNAAMMTAVSTSQPKDKGELVLWDISDPSSPRVVQRFSDVVRVLRDERDYTYVLNQEGLWVVSDKQKQEQPTDDGSWLMGIYG
jgi:hypothetical protein